MRLELTRRADYAVRAMLALAADQERLSAATIAARMAIPPGFLPHVMRDLVAAGLVAATPGRTGGYRPARDPGTISVLDVIEAIEGDGRRRTCVLRNAPCGRDGYCAIHRVFSSAQDALLDELDRAMLTDVGPLPIASPIASGPSPRGRPRAR
ncbi:MAG TPA: Rrf2 family transcriptional regulator [Candidatus Limnocylindrales bacterium]|nr:Rrf2 family transcriptional regulator [Candidatus Limnocylindrales bacterium]